ncbi:hypothetical protein [Vannielia litorea]|uniref:hypothetical protein n=1 Tax=Vannielia litorea TaxID=1217970 RepID=UPI001C957ADD|nr:hypothetical protein [Vannielia litorea]MBY6048189.1 hypothetical protein [Vannielia litorea]MBY6075603.1 hypothetical protein [Vannielia litorea]
MPEKLDKSTIISGGAHLGLIGWALIGGVIHWESPAETVTNVSMISGDEYAALVSNATDPAAAGPEVPEAPETPEPPETEPETPEPPAPETEPQPSEAPPPRAAEVAPDEAPDTSALEPLPEAEVTETAPPAPEAPVAAPDEPPGASLVLDSSRRPKERPAQRVAPTPAVAPEPDAAVDTEMTEAAEPTPAEEEPAQEAQEDTAPEAANTEIVTEAEEPAGGEVVALAPTGSPRPKSRPARRAPEAEPARAETSQDTSDAIADAVADAVSEGQSASEPANTTPSRSGPPMTAGEKDALRVAVQQCWNVGSLSTDALRVTVTVLVAMNENGTPDNGSIRMVGSDGGSDDAVRQAFEAARRAIIRCGSRGFPLPAEKYGEWAEIEMVFNPEKMRIK